MRKYIDIKYSFSEDYTETFRMGLDDFGLFLASASESIESVLKDVNRKGEVILSNNSLNYIRLMNEIEHQNVQRKYVSGNLVLLSYPEVKEPENVPFETSKPENYFEEKGLEHVLEDDINADHEELIAGVANCKKEIKRLYKLDNYQ
jgi:hypothetical protein